MKLVLSLYGAVSKANADASDARSVAAAAKAAGGVTPALVDAFRAVLTAEGIDGSFKVRGLGIRRWGRFVGRGRGRAARVGAFQGVLAAKGIGGSCESARASARASERARRLFKPGTRRCKGPPTSGVRGSMPSCSREGWG
jgi:hypothetical protein